MFDDLQIKLSLNKQTYLKSATLRFYNEKDSLIPAEKYLFDKYVSFGSKVLDIGVGAGRTTGYLKDRSGSYFSIDLYGEMVDLVKVKFQDVFCEQANAVDLSLFADEAFDIVIFSFNGFDEILDEFDRQSCINEIYRVLRSDGIFIFSSHNASQLIFNPILHNAPKSKVIWRIVYSLLRSVGILFKKRLGFRYTKSGLYKSSVHGGLIHYASTLDDMKSFLTRNKFKVNEIIGFNWPSKLLNIAEPAFYYVAKKNSSN